MEVWDDVSKLLNEMNVNDVEEKVIYQTLFLQHGFRNKCLHSSHQHLEMGWTTCKMTDGAPRNVNTLTLLNTQAQQRIQSVADPVREGEGSRIIFRVKCQCHLQVKWTCMHQGVWGLLKGPRSFWLFNAQICILQYSRDSSLISDN